MSNQDYYKTLQIDRDASPEAIKKAYRKLASQHHPDKGGDHKKFKDINEAYQVIGDKDKRAKYDQFGSAAFDPNAGFSGGQGFGNMGGFEVNFGDMGDLGDILGGMFGNGGGRSRGPKRGSDIETEVALDFLESVHGATKKVKSAKKKAPKLGEKIVKLGGKNSGLMNALAWQILTGEEIKHRDLELAMKAAQAALDASKGKDAAILDTYARALWDTGKKAEAAEYEKKAIAACEVPEMKKELEKTLKKYEKEAGDKKDAKKGGKKKSKEENEDEDDEDENEENEEDEDDDD